MNTYRFICQEFLGFLSLRFSVYVNECSMLLSFVLKVKLFVLHFKFLYDQDV